jgi:hypothetical protein
MKIHSAPLIYVFLGCLFATLISMSALADPFSSPELAVSDQSTRYAEFRNVPEFKMTYRTLRNASLERRKRADMAAMEVRGKKPRAEKEGSQMNLHKNGGKRTAEPSYD